MVRLTRRYPIPAVGALIFERNHVLLVQRGNAPARGRWAIPGGRVEWGELLAEAVAREVLEETGIRVSAGEMIYWFEPRTNLDSNGMPQFHYVILDFLAVPITPRQVPRPGDDALDARWIPLDELDSVDIVRPSLMLIQQHTPKNL